MSKKSFRRPDQLPKLRRLPESGELLAFQDLDGTIFPVIVIGIDFERTKKGKVSKLIKGIIVLNGNQIVSCMLHDLKIIP